MITFKEFLKSEVKPALGCTEPAAVAFAAARGAEELRAKPTHILVKLSENIFKNGKDVGIPGTDGRRGNELAAALGGLIKDSTLGLEVLFKVNTDILNEALQMIEEKRVEVSCLHGVKDVYIELTLKDAEEHVKVILEKNHSNITLIKKNGEVVYQSLGQIEKATDIVFETFKQKKLEDIMVLLDEIDEEDEEYLLMGAEMNDNVAVLGIKDKNAGLRIGSTILEMIEQGILSDEPIHYVRLLSSAASDARMSGMNLPVMSSAGSGNHGLVATIPISYLGKKLEKERSEIAKALAISHLVTSYIKSYIGRLSATCGCAIAAGSGAAAGLTYLNAGSIEQVKIAVKTVLSTVSGMLCDGAKESCALKVGVAAAESFLSSHLALMGSGVTYAQGLIEVDTTDTAQNLGKLDIEGMKNVDEVIINLLENRYKKLSMEE